MENQKTYFLVDTENIRDRWKRLLPMEPNQEMFLFYTQNSPGIPYSLLDAVIQYKELMHFIPCYTGQNAMDFQLVTELGYLIAREPQAAYVICSNDHGYDPVCRYWTQKEIQVRRQPFCSEKEGDERRLSLPEQVIANRRLSESMKKAEPQAPEAAQPKAEPPKPNVPAQAPVRPEPPVPNVPVQAVAKPEPPMPAQKAEKPVSKAEKPVPKTEKPVPKAEKPSPKAEKPKEKPLDPARIRQLVQKHFPSDCSAYIEPTVQILRQHGSQDMAKIYQAYLKKFGQKKGLEIYKKLRTSLRLVCKAL